MVVIQPVKAVASPSMNVPMAGKAVPVTQVPSAVRKAVRRGTRKGIAVVTIQSVKAPAHSPICAAICGAAVLMNVPIAEKNCAR